MTAWTVFKKEVLDNFRDRRTLLSALVLGPLFGPALFAALINMMLERTLDRLDEPLDIPVVGAEFAPNLIGHLRQEDIHVKADHGLVELVDAEAAVRAGAEALVLIVSEDYADAINRGEPGRVTLVVDEANTQNSSSRSRVRRALRGYSETIVALRLAARGMSPSLLRPMTVDSADVSTPTGRSVLLLGMMTYFLLFAMLVGGLYLAIDTTAGERERSSLEPLLTLPVTRTGLLSGKMLATVFYMLLSLALSITAFAIALGFVPLERLGMATSFNVGTAVMTFAAIAPFAILGAALMTVVASFTKSYKEAQSYLTVVLFVPTLPILIASIYQVKPSLELMLVPSLAQHLLVTELIKGEPLNLLFYGVSAASVLAFGAIAWWVAAKLYAREGLLG